MVSIKRIYNFSDVILLEYAEHIVKSIQDDIDKFTTFDKNFTVVSVDEIRQTIDSIYNIKTDNVIRDELAELTARVNSSLNSCYSCYKGIIYFAEKAFPDNLPIHNQFGKNDIAKAKSNQFTMIMFMENIEKVAAKYRAELIKEGCGESLLDSISEYKKALLESNRLQESYKKERAIITQDRLVACNSLYKKLRPVNEISKIIFANDPARLLKYALPSSKQSGSSNGK